jgi:adenylate cyclase
VPRALAAKSTSAHNHHKNGIGETLDTMRFHFKSFRNRLLALFLGLLAVVQVAAFLIVNTAATRSARTQIDAALKTTAESFRELLHERTGSLLVAARLLSGDFAFKKAYSTHEHKTILSALNNHRERIGADMMFLVALDETVIADTLHSGQHGKEFAYTSLIEAAEEHDYGEASAVLLVDGRPVQMVVVPLLTPTPDAWICVGFVIEDQLAKGLKEISNSEISFITRGGENDWAAAASTLTKPMVKDLKTGLRQKRWQANTSAIFVQSGEQFVSLLVPLKNSSGKVLAVLQRSLDLALAPTRRLSVILAGLFTLGLALSALAATVIARRVTRPVLTLVDGANRVKGGNFDQPVEVDQQDELGELANSFNTMMSGLAERDRVRDLLGKVVSMEIAEELLSKDIELGGEEREVTILFSDVRNFTSLCENRSPQDVLSILNEYLTRVSSVIESEGGVVDKFIGDAVMSLFGAPLHHADDASRALRTAAGMCHALKELNLEFREQGKPELTIGIGINTAVVVAGNMGSQTRLNYTVIGDGVNLASRLEGLTKFYGVPVIVSGETRNAAPEFLYRELDLVCVKGKKEPVAIYQPIVCSEEEKPEIVAMLDTYDTCLQLYRNRDWDGAIDAFTSFARLYPDDTLCPLYLNRLAQFRLDPPAADWNGVVEFASKSGGLNA